MRPPVAPPAGLPAVPAVIDPRGAALAFPPDGDPDEFAVPAPLVPGALFTSSVAIARTAGIISGIIQTSRVSGSGDTAHRRATSAS